MCLILAFFHTQITAKKKLKNEKLYAYEILIQWCVLLLIDLLILEPHVMLLGYKHNFISFQFLNKKRVVNSI